MSTKIKLGQVTQLQKELTSLLGEKISFSVKWEIKTMLDSIKDAATNLNETVSEIYKKYGEEISEGNFKIKEDKISIANKELVKLTEKEIEVSGKLALSDLSGIESDFQYYDIFSLVEK
jgi:hypothetical protein